MKDSSYLRGHRAFCSLKPRELEDLALGFSILFCPAGKSFIIKDSPLEGLYLLESGLCRYREEEGEPLTLAPGDLFFEDNLKCPGIALAAVNTLEDSRILYLDRDYFQRWVARYPRAVKRLELRSPEKGKKNTSSPGVLKEKRLLWLLKTIPWILFPPVIFVKFFFRHHNGTFLEGTNLVCRYFRVRTLKNTNLTIPLEQIQSVEVVQKGIMSRLLKMGDLLVRVNGSQGNLLIRNIPNPGEEQERILSLKRLGEEYLKAKKHRSIRRDIASWIQTEEGVIILEEGLQGKKMDPVLAVEFGKSFFILLSRGWWQLLLISGCGVLILWGQSQEVDWLIFPYLALLASLLIFIYTLIDWLNDKYKIEEGYLLDLNREPLGKNMVRKQAELESIQNVIAEQKGFWANIFDYGDVRVIVPGSGSEICLSGVRNPRKVQERILSERKRWKELILEKENKASQEDLKLYLSYASQELFKKDRS